jgi:hypothetical protein
LVVQLWRWNILSGKPHGMRLCQTTADSDRNVNIRDDL